MNYNKVDHVSTETTLVTTLAGPCANVWRCSMGWAVTVNSEDITSRKSRAAAVRQAVKLCGIKGTYQETYEYGPNAWKTVNRKAF